MSRLWRQLSIRWQLVVLFALALVLVELGGLSLDYWSDTKQRKAMAVEQAETLSRALQHDLIRAITNPQADIYSDISFRISGFNSIVSLTATNSEDEEIFRYVQEGFSLPLDISEFTESTAVFSERYLYIKQPLIVDDYQFGEIFFLVDLTSYNTGVKEQLLFRLTIFPVGLFIALLLAWWISQAYTRPFSYLAEAIAEADASHADFPKVETHAENEIGILYRGYNDLTAEITRTTEELSFWSEHDSLTRLLNRYAIDKKMSYCLTDSSHKTSALLLLDIDQFKLVNDAAGYVAGDELLKQLAQVISVNMLVESDVARVGGDDFLILLPGASEYEGIRQAEKLLQVLKDVRFTWKGEVFGVSACVGIVIFKPYEFTLQALKIAADTAFFTAKGNGHGQLNVYKADDEKNQQYGSDVQIIAIVNDALQHGTARFELHAQLIEPLQEKSEKVSYEILLRLRNVQGEMMFPDTFLPAANRYQLMIAIDTYVLWNYLEMVTAYPEHIKQLNFVNINMGGSTLNSRVFQDKLKQAIEYFDFPWEKLVLEVTETSAVGNLAQASEFIGYCRDLGMRVALDDFGTGMASFEYLKHLPFDVVKIDGSFVRDMLDDPVDHAMVSYVHEISRLRGQKTIAEYVELPEHLEALKKIGIDYGQGYFLGKPKPLTEWF